jgi:hypothetical protein
MKTLHKVLFLSLLLFAVAIYFSPTLQAQCAMCAATVESNAKEGQTKGAGLNTGILYLMSIPYVLFSVVGFLFWKKAKRNKTKKIRLETF